MNRLRLPCLSLLAGLVVSLSLPPLGTDFLPWSGVILLGALAFFYQLQKSSPRFLLGWLYGFGLLAPQLFWCGNVFLPAYFIVPAFFACFYGAAVCGAGDSPWRFAAALTAAEFARSLGWLAFPWGITASAVATTAGERLLPWISLWGVAWLIHLAAAAIAARRLSLMLSLLVVALCVRFAPASPPSASSRLQVALIQAAFPDSNDPLTAARREQLLAMTREAVRDLSPAAPRLIVWTETVLRACLNREPDMVTGLQGLAERHNSVLICGAPSCFPDDTQRNSAYVFAPGQVPGRYDKFQLVPWGEYFPGFGPDREHRFLPAGVGEFSPAIMPWPVGRFGILICFEGTFPRLARTLVQAGAEVLVVISNDVWESSPFETRQNWLLTRLRAIETGRPLLRAGNAGVSGGVEADGMICLPESAPFARTTITGSAPLASAFSLTLVLGDWLGWLALLGLPFHLTAKALNTQD